MNRITHLSPRRFWLLLFSVAVMIGLIFVGSSWSQPKDGSVLYGKLADTRDWIEDVGSHTPSVLNHVKVTINSLPPQTTYTDEQGQFWFKGLRDIAYTLKVELPYDRQHPHSFRADVNGDTGRFFDIGMDETHSHSRRAIDY